MLDELACRFGWSLEVMARTTVRFEHCGGCGTNGRWSARTRAPSHHPIRAGAKANGPSGPDNNIVLGIVRQTPSVKRRLSTAACQPPYGCQPSYRLTGRAVPSECVIRHTVFSAGKIPCAIAQNTVFARLLPPEWDRRKAPVPRIPARECDSFQVLANYEFGRMARGFCLPVTFFISGTTRMGDHSATVGKSCHIWTPPACKGEGPYHH